ncbi:FAD-dependent oxidoreductase [Asanoa ishikariensis]|uniref:2-polyprenyl-6-methoxyphenol hydroxylase n=1 Tax=Asanoa ishikariensis TaxID=137265 RepID=A0A1H3T186_9ACTN|nr:FAD-dependent monooxygenase [Asanoa ishikariensis]GIF63139.1 FAD-dependent oxidoreductase [Asanoa ishikariensis]SDZ44036.1 2-polyprenyl-6-methoxyphenol hydroxylase [Asanoa ishikariensis]
MVVVVVGAGPVGLMLASELSRSGVRPLVLEALPSPSLSLKANGVVGRSVPLLYERGLFPRRGPAPRFMYGGFPLDLRRLRDNPVYVQPVPQRELESLLASRAGVPVHRGHTVVALRPSSDRVLVSVEGPSGPYTVDASYVVGCDGAHSMMRKAAGLGFPGVSDDRVVSRSAHVVLPLTFFRRRLRGPGGPYRPYLFHRTPQGVFSFARFGRGPHLVTTLEWDATVDETVPVTVDEVRQSLGRVLGRSVRFAAPAGPGPHVLRRSTARQNRLASSYASGRVLLAGDAAHVVAGFGGPLLNLGLLDAVDLASRLARDDVSGYDAARRPWAERVLASSAEQAALLSPGAETDARRAEFARYLALPEGLKRVADTIAGG